jgi:serine/threonine protein kinase
MLDDERNVKLIDFGFSTQIPNTQKVKLFCGTPSYMAPEIVLKTEYCGPPADVYATGVLLFAFFCGCFPFKGENDQELYKKIATSDLILPDHVPAVVKTIL